MVNLASVFRREWGPAVAAITRWSGDLTIAEDAVQEACAEALRTCCRDGPPERLGGWLVTVARNRVRDRLRRESARPGKEMAAVIDEIRARTDGSDPHPVRDDELRMMFTCAHPALDRQSQLALTLRLVSGLTVAEIVPRAAADRDCGRSANHPRQEQGSPCQYPAASAAGRGAGRADSACARLHLLGVHRGLLVHGRSVGDS